MTDRYRIIEHRDNNDFTFYTVQFEVQWILGLKFWRTLPDQRPEGYTHRYRMFSTLEDAQRFIRGQTWTQVVVEEGTV